MHQRATSCTSRRPRRHVAVLLGVTAVLLSACTPAAANRSGAEAALSSSTAIGVDVSAVSAQLQTLAVKGRAPKTGYTREQFGQAWSDAATGVGMARNGCDTRNDILRRDLTSTKVDSNGCTVKSGRLSDSYTGKTIDFVRGPRSADVQIDHVVPLSNAWQTGAQQLSAAQRLALANDPDNLMAVDGPTNSAKGDGDAATWLPPNRGYWCAYVARQVTVKAKYHLWVTPAEHDRIAQILTSCPQGAGAPSPGVPSTSAPSASSSSLPTATAVKTSAPATAFTSCADARAAGATPVRRGDAGYSTSLDRDGDGVACE